MAGRGATVAQIGYAWFRIEGEGDTVVMTNAAGQPVVLDGRRVADPYGAIGCGLGFHNRLGADSSGGSALRD